MRLTAILSSAALMLWAGAALAVEPAAAPTVTQVKGTTADGTRFYEDSLVIDAPAHVLWTAFTDASVYRQWGSPVSAIDFRLGGAIEASYDPHGHLGDPQNIKNAFIAYIPDRLLVFQNIQAPDGLPGKEAYGKTVKTLEFQSLSAGQTRVTVSGVGFGPGPAFDRLYTFFAGGDAQMLISLKQAMETKSLK